ncbi:RDD family protein [Enterovirga rhinocerotis]|uniref:Putative RDD family membrane protein YckC n=1 Tax=Enterovirga rhinocerotis TaxID=1339210 RepID=A0A4R7CA53_9HYPH|nr:RDD family protein [Enterovirga rhinocerotis]TDR93846.1 putative RDD family membrane protein YckC [Enterovirga rhinocerotis]
MSNSDYASRSSAGPQSIYAMSPIADGRTDGVLSRRVIAYLIDLVVISFLVVLFAILIFISGIFTLGLTWGLYVILIPGTAILYSALTIGGASMGTIGMRLSGLAAVDASSGQPAGVIVAGLHALLFYVGIGTLLLFVLDVVIGLARSDRRLGHDLLADIIVVRR